MKINLNCNNGVQSCGNNEAFEQYAAVINEHEQRYTDMELAQIMKVGSIACEGCGSWGSCGAKLIETRVRLINGGFATHEWPIRTEHKDRDIINDDIDRLVDGFKRFPAEAPTKKTSTRRFSTVAGGIIKATSSILIRTFVPEV